MTNDPDYYIPEQSCKKSTINDCPVKSGGTPLNELNTTKKYKENKPVCPLMINTPWAEFRSGDSEPEAEQKSL